MSQSNAFKASEEYLEQSEEACHSTQMLGQVGEMVEQKPVSSVLLCFGVGLGVGLAIGTTLVASMQQETKTRTAERMGHQFMDMLNRAVPDSLSSRFSS